MNQLRSGLIAGLSLASLVMSMPNALAAAVSAGDADGTPTLLTELQFNATVPMASTIARTSTTAATLAALPTAAIGASGWAIGAQNGGSVGVESTMGPNGTIVDALEGVYPAGDANQAAWASYNISSLHTEDVYIEFWAKMPAAKGGLKFVKIFGDRSNANYANTTFGPDYTGIQPGALLQVLFGDGTTVTNDGQNSIRLDGSDPRYIGRSYGTAVVQTPQMSGFSAAAWGTGWHHFLIHVKFNSGTTAQNQVPDGEIFLEIDGKVYVDATGLYNRNPANGPIDVVELFGWAQNNPQPFQVWFDDVRISTGGFMTQSLPNPPSNVAAE
jgi:hypothetical protein